MTNHQKIIVLMSRDPSRYFYPHDFMRPDLGELFVGYLAPRRLRELKADYPDIFEVKKGKNNQLLTRLKMETINDWYYDLPDNLKKCLRLDGKEPTVTSEELLARNGYKIREDNYGN